MAPILTFAMTAAITPGPNNIILSTNAVNFGFRKTIPLILGVFFGFMSVLTLCSLFIFFVLQLSKFLLKKINCNFQKELKKFKKFYF